MNVSIVEMCQNNEGGEMSGTSVNCAPDEDVVYTLHW